MGVDFWKQMKILYKNYQKTQICIFYKRVWKNSVSTFYNSMDMKKRMK